MEEIKSAARVTVVGGFTTTLIAQTDRLPSLGQAAAGCQLTIVPDGRGSNQAVQCARLGGEVELVASLGADAPGAQARQLYASEGVGTTFLEQADARATGARVILRDRAGNRREVYDPGANELLSPGALDRAADRIHDSLVVMTNLEIPAETALCSLQLTRRGEGVGILNPTPTGKVTRELLITADLMTPNEVELRELLGRAPDDPTESLDLCRALLELGVPRVILTRGALGALIVTPDGYLAIPASPVPLVDPTGAGDAFHGALAAALAMHLPLEPAVRRAVAAGALACTRAGVVDALPHTAELEQFLTTGTVPRNGHVTQS